MPIDVGVSGLRTAYAMHRDSAEALPPGASACLLRIYAVECGLKAALLKRENKRDTGELEETDRTHDLRYLIRRLRLPRSQLESLFQGCALNSGSQRQVFAGELHQVWRYGSTLRDRDQKRMEEHLQIMLVWLREELRR